MSNLFKCVFVCFLNEKNTKRERRFRSRHFLFFEKKKVAFCVCVRVCCLQCHSVPLYAHTHKISQFNNFYFENLYKETSREKNVDSTFGVKEI